MDRPSTHCAQHSEIAVPQTLPSSPLHLLTAQEEAKDVIAAKYTSQRIYGISLSRVLFFSGILLQRGIKLQLIVFVRHSSSPSPPVCRVTSNCQKVPAVWEGRQVTTQPHLHLLSSLMNWLYPCKKQHA